MQVKLMVNHFLISDDAGHQTRVNFSDLTAAEETELRALVVVQPRNIRKAKCNSRAGSQDSRKVNYAELVCGRDAAGVNENKIN